MHNGIVTVVHFQELEQKRKMRLLNVDKNTEKFVILIDLSHQKFQKISIICFIFLLSEVIVFRNKFFLVNFDQKIGKLLFLFESFEKKLK